MPLSARQMEYLALAWQCFETEPKIDYDKFREVAGLSSANSARELMRVTKNKLKSEYGALSGSIQATNGGGGGTPKSTTKATPRKSASKAKGTPSATGKATPRTASRASVSPTKKNGALPALPDHDEDDDDEEDMVIGGGIPFPSLNGANGAKKRGAECDGEGEVATAKKPKVVKAEPVEEREEEEEEYPILL